MYSKVVEDIVTQINTIKYREQQNNEYQEGDFLNRNLTN